MKQIAAAFVKAQRSFAPALKTNTNPHFRSKYVALDGCIEAVIDALNTNGIALLQPAHECADGVMVETLFLHESGETLSGGRLHVPAAKQDPQGYGSALTYARRYSLMAACGIAPEDDDGNAASRKPAKAANAPISPLDGAQDRVPPEELEVLRELAADVVDLCQKVSPEAAQMKVDEANLDNDQKAALWDLLKPNSAVRSALKKVTEARRMKAAA